MDDLENKILKISNKISNDDSDLLSMMYRYATQTYELNSYERILKSTDAIPAGKIIIEVEKVDFNVIWNTKMRSKITNIMKEISKIDIEELNAKGLHNILKNTVITTFESNANNILKIDELINQLRKNPNVSRQNTYYICDNLSNKNIFFINEMEKVVKAIEVGSNKDEYIYDTVCEDLENNFLKFNFCNFKNNKCVSQRHKNVFLNDYPTPNTDGCCFKVFKKCKYNNKDGTCQIKCISCKLFICPYLSKLGIGYYASEILLLRTFYTPRQRRIYVNSFFTKKAHIINKIVNQNRK